jgi:hypothetical protein
MPFSCLAMPLLLFAKCRLFLKQAKAIPKWSFSALRQLLCKVALTAIISAANKIFLKQAFYQSNRVK